MKMKTAWFAGKGVFGVFTLVILALCLFLSPLAIGQTINSSNTGTITCDLLVSGQPETAGCTHQFVGDELYKSASSGGLVITVAVDQGSKDMRAIFGISNSSPTSVDVIPADFSIEVSSPHSKTLHYVSPEKIAEAEEKKARQANSSRRIRGGFANVLSALAGEESGRQTTTTTTSSGTVRAQSSDGTSIHGTYEGNSTSTTTSPDYAAQQRAAEQIRQRNYAIAAANAQRNAAASATNARLMQTALRANTVAPGGSIGGIVNFEGDKHAKAILVRARVASTLYEFRFNFE